MSVIYKKELSESKFMFYSKMYLYGKTKRLRKKGERIIFHQIDEYCGMG